MKCKGYTLANLWTEKVREFNFNVKRQELGGGGVCTNNHAYINEIENHL